MKPEELLKTLRDGGLDDEAIKALLAEVIASLDGKAGDDEEEAKKAAEAAKAEKEEASRLLGVEL